MRTHPLIDVNHVTPDLELVARVPHEMALYYMALPLAREDGEVSVAIAHPENAAALARLSRLLDGPIVPVRGSSAAIRSLLQAMRPTGAPSTPGILFWSGRAEWQPAAAAWAEQLSRLLDAPVARCDIPGTVPGGILRQRHKLVILGQPINGAGLDIFEQAAGPLFLMRSASVAPLRRILVVLRGFSSDEQVLQWGARLAQRGPADLTLLPMNSTSPQTPYRALEDNGSYRQEIENFFRSAETGDIRACLSMRSGDPVRQIADEAANGSYDLILISAEGDGVFVGRVLAELDRCEAHSGRPVLILRPSI
ncbi:MAG: universal stress protein [Chloroflexota bacterium]|nr:universal stress protein [Chloroflexota bacterium]